MAITTYTTALAALTGASDANFRVWGKALTDTFDALGLTQVYSNVDWTTAVMPTTVNTYNHKRVYSINDSLSGTREIYIAVEFGRGSIAVSAASDRAVNFVTRVTVGRIHSAGTVTGAATTMYVASGSTTAAGEIVGVRTDYGFIVFANAAFENYANPVISVERVRDNAGAVTGDGAILAMTGANINSYGAASTTQGQLPNCAAVNFVSSIAYGTNAARACSAINYNVAGSAGNPLHLSKVPVSVVLTWGDYWPLSHLVIVPVQVVGANKLFNATVNGALGQYRTTANVPCDSTINAGWLVG